MDYYASDKGSDSAAGTDPAAPMSLHAANKAYSRDTLYIMGQPSGNLDRLSGVVRIRPYQADTAVMDVPSGTGFAMVGPGELDIAGINLIGHGQGCGVFTQSLWDVVVKLAKMQITGFTWAKGNPNAQDGVGVCLGQCHDVNLTDVGVSGCTMYAFGLEEVTGYSMIRCAASSIPGSQDNLPGLADSGGGACIASSWFGRVERFTASELGASAAHMGSGLILFFGGKSEVLMCDISGIRGGMASDGAAICLDGTSKNLVHDNDIHDTGTPGIISGCMDGTDHDGNRIVNNRLLNCNGQFPGQDGYLCVYERYPAQEDLTKNLRTVVQGNVMAGTPGIGLNTDVPQGSMTQIVGNFNNVPGPTKELVAAPYLLLARQHGVLARGKRVPKGWRL